MLCAEPYRGRYAVIIEEDMIAFCQLILLTIVVLGKQCTWQVINLHCPNSKFVSSSLRSMVTSLVIHLSLFQQLRKLPIKYLYMSGRSY